MKNLFKMLRTAYRPYKEDKPSSPMSTVSDVELEIFEYVADDAKEGYAKKLDENTLTTMSLPPSDFTLSRMETVVFDPKDVKLPNRNWMIDTFGGKLDYRDFKKLDNGQKFLVYHLDTGVDKAHPSMEKAVIKQLSFTGEPVGDRNVHGTQSASMYGSTNINFSAFPEKVERGEIVIVDMSVLTDNGSGDFNNIIDAINVAVGDAPKRQEQGYLTFMNMSLGADFDTPKSLSEALAKARKVGILPLAATGNSGLDKIGTPANDPSVVAIGATNPDLKRARFGNVGKGLMFAEGGVMVYGATLGGGAGFTNGTSFSCPWAMNLFIAAASLYKFENIEDLFEYVKGVTQDLGEQGYDTTFGYGYGVLRWMLDNRPAKEIVERVGEAQPKPKRSTYNFKSIKGWEISWKEESKESGEAYNTIFVEELDVSYTGNLSSEDAETSVFSDIEQAFKQRKFIVADGTDYTNVAKYVFAAIEQHLSKKNNIIKITSAIIDNNQDGDVVVEYTRPKRRTTVFDPSTWNLVTTNKKSPKLLLRGI